jgi:RNA polymerase sigma-70 factor, ECF subfamily
MSDEVMGAYRAHWVRAVAVLCRWTGDVDLAEDAVQDAAEQALRTWPRDGIPDHPDAWLITTARRAIDRLRRDRRRAERTELLARLEALDRQASLDHGHQAAGADDQLTLILMCRHPALGVDAQVALTLRAVAGLARPRSPAPSWSPNGPRSSAWSGPNARSPWPPSRSGSHPTTSSPTGSGPSARSST